MRAKIKEVIRHNKRLIDERKSNDEARRLERKILGRTLTYIEFEFCTFESVWVFNERLQPLVKYRKNQKRKAKK